MTNYSSGESSSEDIVNFPVPKKYLSALIQALARIIESDQQGSPPQNQGTDGSKLPWPVSEQEAEEIHIDWNEETLSTLRAHLHNVAALTLLDMAADKPNERVYVEEVMLRSDCSHGQVGAGLGVLTRSINKMLNLKGKRFNWPASFQWDVEEQRTFYLMDDEVAKAWKAIESDCVHPTQRNFMCELVRRFGIDDKDRVIQEYADAERKGLVMRRSNEPGLPSKAYASKLWSDGKHKGWLTGANVSDCD
jgi:hypothetical protein